MEKLQKPIYKYVRVWFPSYNYFCGTFTPLVYSCLKLLLPLVFMRFVMTCQPSSPVRRGGLPVWWSGWSRTLLLRRICLTQRIGSVFFSNPTGLVWRSKEVVRRQRREGDIGFNNGNLGRGNMGVSWSSPAVMCHFMFIAEYVKEGNRLAPHVPCLA